MQIDNISTSITEPVTLAEVKSHLKIEHSDEDALLVGMISAARELAEAYCDTVIPEQTFRLTLDDFDSEINIPKVPVLLVTNIEYTDTNGSNQTVGDYNLSGNLFKSMLKPAYGETWPEVEEGYNKVVITFQAGYTSPPTLIKHALKLMIGSLYAQREDHIENATLKEVPLCSRALLNTFRRIVA